ncbi:MAG: DUF3078 domain-containing protein [Rikenellaceae bacterium]
MSKKLIMLLSLCAIFTTQLASSQQRYNADSTWMRGGNFSLSLNQASFINWASGGDNAVGATVQFNYSADYKSNGHLFNNRIEMAYGTNYTESIGNRKSNDKIYLSSTYGYEIAKNLYVSGLLTFQSQFANGYSYNDGYETFTSTFMAPGYLTIGTGITWTPKKWFAATLTPITWREVFVLNEGLSQQGAYGVEVGYETFAEMGANLQMTVEQEIMKNVNLYTRLILFSDYLNKPKNVDVNFEVQINMTINKWLSAFVSANLVYDDNINLLREDGTYGPGLQFKENLGVGLQFSF